MNHQELLDGVVKGMSEKEEAIKSPSIADKVIDEVKSNEDLEQMIKLPSVTGLVYEVDPKTYEWQKAVDNITNFLNNDETIQNYACSMLRIIGHENEKDVIDWMNNAEKEIKAFLEGFGVEDRYNEVAPSINQWQRLMMMIYDASTVNRLMMSEVRNFGTIQMAQMLLMAAGTHVGGEDTTHGELDESMFTMHEEEPDEHEAVLDTEDDQMNVYKVTAILSEGGVEIVSNELYAGDYSLADLGTCKTENGKFITLVAADSASRAATKAFTVFGCKNSEVPGEDDHVSSGLIS